MAPLLWLVAALPVYRRQDAGENPANNFLTFRRCHEELARRGAVALFPEGGSHNQPHSLPLKTGAARIALEAEQRHGALGLRIVPVGLTYEDKSRFRSRVLVRVGAPLDPAVEREGYADAAGGSVRALTARIGAALDALTVSYSSWEQARLVTRVAALVGGETPLSQRSELWLRVLGGYRELERAHPERVAVVRERLQRYEARLERLRLHDEDVAGHTRLVTRLRHRSDLVLGPLGRLLNALPFAITSSLTRRLTRTADETATYALLGGLIVFPSVWVLQALALGLAADPVAGLAALALAPLTGAAALRAHAAHRLRQRVSRWPRPAEMAELRAERAGLADEVRTLATMLAPAPDAS